MVLTNIINIRDKNNRRKDMKMKLLPGMKLRF